MDSSIPNHTGYEPFTYELPEERIAQRPVHPPEAARCLVVSRKNGSIRDRTFREFPELVAGPDTLFLNRSKVIPARLFGTIEHGARRVELLRVRSLGAEAWRCLGRPLRKLPAGTRIEFPEGLVGEVIARAAEFEIDVRFFAPEGVPLNELLDRVGVMPIPLYIRQGEGDSEDDEDYQTPFGAVEGSVAAPTASLHFSPPVMEQLRARQVGTYDVVLHVGPGSFLPVYRDEGSSPGSYHPPAAEEFRYDPTLPDTVRAIREKGGRCVAVGTTVVRAIESHFTPGVAGRAATDLFIAPGYSFQGVDVVVTNFHQPGTSHLLLVEALLGRELLGAVYAHALREGYRFLSYGDGMVIV